MTTTVEERSVPRRIAFCCKCSNSKTKSVGEGRYAAQELIGCSLLSPEEWDDGWNDNDGVLSQHNCPLLKKKA